MKDFTDKTAFITGGANGIGLGIAKVFAREGARVVIADVRQDSLDAALKELPAGRAHAIRVDVADRAAMAAAADETEKVFGVPDLLFLNAGVNLFAPIDESTYEDWDWVLGVNLFGVINGIQTFVPRMKALGAGGHIVNTASMASFLAGASAGIYTVAKFGVRGLSESLRQSLVKHHIGVSVLCPGLVASVINRSDEIRPAELSHEIGKVDAAFMERLAHVQSLGMDPMEVAEAVLEGVRANRAYIFPHPEFKEEMAELFDYILSHFPDGEADPRRAPIEEARRKSYTDGRKAADAMTW